MGTVYLAEQLALAGTVALELLRPRVLVPPLGTAAEQSPRRTPDERAVLARRLPAGWRARAVEAIIGVVAVSKLSVGVVVLAFVAACVESTEAPPYSAACGGPPPSLEDCITGLVHADCGGEVGPVLACAERGADCRWFTGGCVAEGFRASACPASDVCCEDGRWPFADAWVPEAGHAYSCAEYFVAEAVALTGYVPVDATTPAGVEVRIDPDLEVPMVDAVECDGLSLRLCDASPFFGGSAALRPHDTFVASFSPHLVGEVIYVEVVETSAGLVGRVFTGYVTDACPTTVPSCDSARAEPLGLTGTLTINDITGATTAHGLLEVSDAAGGTMRITF